MEWWVWVMLYLAGGCVATAGYRGMYWWVGTATKEQPAYVPLFFWPMVLMVPMICVVAGAILLISEMKVDS